MSITSVGPTGGRINGLGDQTSTRADSNLDRQTSTHESGATFAKLLEGLSQTTLPTTAPRSGAIVQTPSAADAFARWVHQQTDGGSRPLTGADMRAFVASDQRWEIDPASTADLPQIRLK